MSKKPKAKRPATIASRFVPRFWEEADGRQLAVKEIKRRYETLLDHAGADSFQKELLVQRAVFVSVQLETMEIDAAQGNKFDAGVYTQMCNALLGMLKTLGLERRAKEIPALKAYVEGKR